MTAPGALGAVMESLVEKDAFSNQRTLLLARIFKTLLLVALVAGVAYHLERHFVQHTVGLTDERVKFWRMEVPSVAICPGFDGMSFAANTHVKVVWLEGAAYGDMGVKRGRELEAEVQTQQSIPHQNVSTIGGLVEVEAAQRYHMKGCIKASFVNLPEDRKPKITEDFANPVKIVLAADFGSTESVKTRAGMHDVIPVQFAFFDSMDVKQEPSFTSFYGGTTGNYFEGSLTRTAVSWKKFWPWQSDEEHVYQYEYSSFPTPAKSCEDSGMPPGCTLISYQYKSFFITNSVSTYSIWSTTSLIFLIGALAVIANLMNLFNLAFPAVHEARRTVGLPLRILCCGYLSDDAEAQHEDDRDSEQTKPLLAQGSETA